MSDAAGFVVLQEMGYSKLSRADGMIDIDIYCGVAGVCDLVF